VHSLPFSFVVFFFTAKYKVNQVKPIVHIGSSALFAFFLRMVPVKGGRLFQITPAFGRCPSAFYSLYVFFFFNSSQGYDYFLGLFIVWVLSRVVLLEAVFL